MKYKNREEVEKVKFENEYEYSILTVFDEDNCGWDYPIDVLLDNGLGDRPKEEKINYLNVIIKDIEHYRDLL